MRTVLLRKDLGALRPYDDRAAEVVGRMRRGEVVVASFRRARSIQQLRWYWALVGLLWEQQERYATPEQLHNAIKVAVGYYDEIKLRDGRMIAIPHSIAFDKMEQGEFQIFTDKVVKLACEKIIPNMEQSVLKAEVEAMISGGRGT